MTPEAKYALVRQIRAAIAAGETADAAARALGVSLAQFRRWEQAAEVAGLAGLLDGASSGRPPLIELTPEEAAALRRRYVRSNLKRGAGSMSLTARHYALDPASNARQELRDVILRPRASKHTLTVGLRRAIRATDAAVAAYRNPDDARLGGPYAAGCLRMAHNDDGSMRRLRPGERQSWDDATINFCVVVPWPWGGDPCSDRHGVKVGRFQLLAGLDDATDFCVGYSYIIRQKSSYRAEDAVSAMSRAWRDSYTPESAMLEGGVWQSSRAKAFLSAAGVRLIDAKGRPRSKLIEGYWNHLWTVLCMESDGQVGRYRGEMQRETDLLMRCQSGALDPRTCFPSLEQALGAIDRGIAFMNCERSESREYGNGIRQEAHAAGMAARPLPRLSENVAHLAWPVREMRTVRRCMLRAATESPLGGVRPYHFAADDLLPFEGAKVWLHFDPWSSPLRAVATLAEPFRDHPTGHVVSASLPCIDNAPELLHADLGKWQVRFGDGIAATIQARRAAAAAVRREHRSIGIDGRRVQKWVTEIRAQEQNEIARGIGQPAAEPLSVPDTPDRTPEIAPDWAEMEAAAGIVRSA